MCYAFQTAILFERIKRIPIDYVMIFFSDARKKGLPSETRLFKFILTVKYPLF